MKRDGLKGLLQIGFFLLILSLCSVIFQPRDSGEFVVSMCSLGISLMILLITGVIVYGMR